MFTLLNTDSSSRARTGELETAHGTVKTPVFMNVGTQGAIKGGLDSYDLLDINCQTLLSNTYHLHLRPGDELIRSLGGLHKFMSWRRPILTDSGGFQIFSLARTCRISEEGAEFASHIDGRRVFMSPEDSIRVQSNLGSDIAMAFDECIGIPAKRAYTEESCARTYRWLVRCNNEITRLSKLEDTLNRDQMLFGINQGAVFADLRVDHMKRISELDLPGYAIGGLAVGESLEEMYDIVETVEEHMPAEKPRYLMGVGTPSNIIEAVARGIDMFDCVMPARNGRHGHLFTWNGVININNEKHSGSGHPIDERCGCPVCNRHSRAYVRHLLRSGEMLGMRLAVIHNLWFYNDLMARIRDSIQNETFGEFRRTHSDILSQRK
ncbi:MAG: tRNA guanosine(34) transglycosylase Tgt [Clostridiales bacterium]|nr:tRNA guanosine(34) transglycosylase Tgt [Clostridiales bacterium]